MNEFYCVDIYWGNCHYFRSKEAAMAYLWQVCLNNSNEYSDEELEEIRQELNEYYYINGLGKVQVCGFED